MTGDPEEQESESSFPRRNYFAAAFRLRWLFLGPALVLGLCASFAARIWPVTYRSEAMILLDQEKIPEQFRVPVHAQLDGESWKPDSPAQGCQRIRHRR